MREQINANSAIAVIVLDGFSTLSLGAIVEPLRFAADEYPSVFPGVILVALEERSVRSSGGVVLECDLVGTELIRRMSMGAGPKTVIICSSTMALPESNNKLRIILRLASIMGVRTYGLGSITRQMAKMGTLKGKKATTHWKSLAAFAEQHAEVEVTNALFVGDEKTVSCPGEMASIDLVLRLIGEISLEAAADVADHFLISHARSGEMRQPGSQNYRLRSVPEKLAEAVELMSQNIEDPIKITDIAIQCETSVRRLERLFRDHLNNSPFRYYTSLKLERALELIVQTNLSFQEVAIAAGFSSASAMSKRFKQQYGKSPSEYREANMILASVCA